MPKWRSSRCTAAPTARQLRHAVDHGVKGVVVQALGMGNMNVPMLNAVKYALSKQVPVVVATRVHNGRVMPNYGFEGGGKTSFDAGAVMADDLSPQGAHPVDAAVAKRRQRPARTSGRVRSIARSTAVFERSYLFVPANRPERYAKACAAARTR